VNSQPEWIDPLQPFQWRDPAKAQSTAEERKVAIDHICRCLAQGGVELIAIQYSMVPRIPSMTLHHWREENDEWNAQISDAFDVGGAIDMMKAQRIADGIQPLTYGHTTKAQRAQARANERRDRLRVHVMFRRIEAIHRRYKPRTILEGDNEHPLIPSKFEITPVRPQVRDEPGDRTEEE
jgi:hypothetical protein